MVYLETSFIFVRIICIVLNGITLDQSSINAGVPPGSVLGPLLFLVDMNDLTDNISSQMHLFADVSSLFTYVEGVEETLENLVNDVQTITKQAIKVIFTVKKKIRSWTSHDNDLKDFKS